MRISIIIPAYNEEKRIGKTLKSYSDYFNNLNNSGKLDYEIIVVINNTKDKTKEIVEDAKKNNDKIRYIDLERGGKGYAITEGFKDAIKRKNELIGFVDADLATTPEEYVKLIDNINNCDAIIADRYLKDSKVYPPNTFRRLVVSRIFNLLTRTLFFFNFRDTQCGAKVFRREVIMKVLPKLSFSFWAFDVDLLYNIKKLGFRIKSFPTTWIDKEYSKINFWKAGPWMALGIFKLRLINSPLRDLEMFYDFVFNKIKK